MSPLREIISYNRRAFHDELHMLQQPDVLHRVPNYRDYVGVFADR